MAIATQPSPLAPVAEPGPSTSVGHADRCRGTANQEGCQNSRPPFRLTPGPLVLSDPDIAPYPFATSRQTPLPNGDSSAANGRAIPEVRAPTTPAAPQLSLPLESAAASIRAPYELDMIGSHVQIIDVSDISDIEDEPLPRRREPSTPMQRQGRARGQFQPSPSVANTPS